MTPKPKKDGGQAFPRPRSENDNEAQGGMTLRQWYAGQALAGIMADGWGDLSAAVRAASAFKLADSMLKHEEGEK